MKAWRFFLMKRAKPDVIFPAAFERDALANELDNVRSLEDKSFKIRTRIAVSSVTQVRS